QAITFRRRGESERDAGIARGRLDQHGAAGLDTAVALGRLDHGEADPVFHRGQRVEELAFAENVGLDVVRGGDARQPDERRRANRLDDRVIDAAAKFLRGPGGLFGGIGHGVPCLYIVCAKSSVIRPVTGGAVVASHGAGCYDSDAARAGSEPWRTTAISW